MANPEQKSTKLKGVLPEHFVKSQTNQGKVQMLAEIFPDMSREISGATAKNFFEGMAGDQEAYDTFKSASRGDKGAIAKVAERLVGASNQSNRQLAKIALDVIDSSSPAPAGRPRRRATRPADNSNGVPVSGNDRTTSEPAASAPIAAEPAPVTPVRSAEPAPAPRSPVRDSEADTVEIPVQSAAEPAPQVSRPNQPPVRPGFDEPSQNRNESRAAAAQPNDLDPDKIEAKFGSHVGAPAYSEVYGQNGAPRSGENDPYPFSAFDSQRGAGRQVAARRDSQGWSAEDLARFRPAAQPGGAEFAPDFEASDERTEERRGFLRKALDFTGNAIAKASGFTGLALMSGVIFLGNRSEKGRQIVEAMTPEQRAKYQRRVSIGSNLLISAATLWTLATKTHAMDWMPGIGGSGSQGGNTPDSDRLVDATQGGPDKPAGPAATSEVPVPPRRKAFNGLFRGFNLSSEDDEREPATPGNANYLWENAVDTSTREGKTRVNDFNVSIPLAEAGNEDSVHAMLNELDAQFQGNTLELASFLGDARIEGAPWREHYDSQQDYTDALRAYAKKLDGDEGEALRLQQYNLLADKFSNPLTTYEKVNNWNNYGSWLINHETGELEWDPDVEVKTVEDSEECKITFPDGTVIKVGHCGQDRVPQEYVLPEPVAPAAPVEQETDEPYYPAPQAPESAPEPVPYEQEDEPAPEPPPAPEQPLPPAPPEPETPVIPPWQPPVLPPWEPPVSPPTVDNPKPPNPSEWQLPGSDGGTDAGTRPQTPVDPGILTSPIDVPTPGSNDTPGSTTGIKPETSSPGGSGITPGPAESAGSGAGAAATPDGQSGRSTTPQ